MHNRSDFLQVDCFGSEIHPIHPERGIYRWIKHFLLPVITLSTFCNIWLGTFTTIQELSMWGICALVISTQNHLKNSLYSSISNCDPFLQVRGVRVAIKSILGRSWKNCGLRLAGGRWASFPVLRNRKGTESGLPLRWAGG